MCELFAISSSNETEVSFSLDEFSKHGGLTDHHRHGWGLAYYAQNTARIIKEASQASNSLCLEFVKSYHIRSKIIMSHIRYATQGDVSFRNTQPFARELAGREHVFMHNGDLNGVVSNPKYMSHRFKAMGETDSESAFCYLMTQMAKIWDAPDVPTLVQRQQVFNYFAQEMHELGLANFIYSDSEYIFIYSHKRVVKDKEDKSRSVTLPGLHVLQRKCFIDASDTTIKGLKMSQKQPKSVVLISSVPLNEENWIALKSQESMVLKDGEIIADIN
jgi:glutamine amidotransferase